MTDRERITELEKQVADLTKRMNELESDGKAKSNLHTRLTPEGPSNVSVFDLFNKKRKPGEDDPSVVVRK